MSVWEEAAALTIFGPPSFLSSFRAKLLQPEADFQPSIFVDYLIGCKGCGSEEFKVLCFPKTVPDPSPYHGFKPGEILMRPPHRLQCSACGTTSLLFDPQAHGYDGVAGNGTSYELGDGQDAPAGGDDGKFRVVIGLGYSFEVEDLRNSAKEIDCPPSDLFDSFTLHGTSTVGKDNMEISYECA